MTITIIDIKLTVVALPSGCAVARVFVYSINARSSVFTGIGIAVINIVFAVVAIKAICTGTRVVIEKI